MAPTDHYYREAKRSGYRSRAAFKLKQLDAEVNLFSSGDTVVDLGAAPGGWLQVAAEAVGEAGRVIGVDLNQIEPLDSPEATVETIQGDLTDEELLEGLIDRLEEGGVDVVLSDMAPDMTGEYGLDHARSVHLAEQAATLARELLAGGGDFVVKVFQGPELDALRSDLEADFEYVRTVSPPASRDASSEVYLVGKGHLKAPVRAGDRLEVEIEATGSEGDGIAYLDGYTLFVPETTPGDRVEVEIEAIKPRFGFAHRIEPT